jgi:SAGA-associated factor 73
LDLTRLFLWQYTDRLAAPPASTSTSKSGLVDGGAVKDALGDKEKKHFILKIKKPAPKPSIAGNWKESDTISKAGLAAISLLY